jgi:hypothetical protein
MTHDSKERKGHATWPEVKIKYIIARNRVEQENIVNLLEEVHFSSRDEYFDGGSGRFPRRLGGDKPQ